MTRTAVEVAKLAVSYTDICGIRVAVNDPGDHIAGNMLLTKGIGHRHQIAGRCILKKEHSFLYAQMVQFYCPVQ